MTFGRMLRKSVGVWRWRTEVQEPLNGPHSRGDGHSLATSLVHLSWSSPKQNRRGPLWAAVVWELTGSALGAAGIKQSPKKCNHVESIEGPGTYCGKRKFHGALLAQSGCIEVSVGSVWRIPNTSNPSKTWMRSLCVLLFSGWPKLSGAPAITLLLLPGKSVFSWWTLGELR